MITIIGFHIIQSENLKERDKFRDVRWAIGDTVMTGFL
jgi:hypothetical protein